MFAKSKTRSTVVVCSLCGYLGPAARQCRRLEWYYLLLAATGIGLVPVAVIACSRRRQDGCPSCRTTRCLTVVEPVTKDEHPVRERQVG